MRQPVVLLDSGAFTAWTQKAEISVEDYGRFCLEHLDDLDYIANLDVIPGEFGQKDLPPEEIERSARAGWQNYRTLLGMGLPKDKLIHIFHQGEDFKWLRRMVKAMPYIGLSPANDRTRNEKIVWLDQCMKYVTDPQGMPLVKFHGFAVTSFKIMTRYPWFSVDSTSWVMTAAMGAIYVPRSRAGEWDYSQDPWKVDLSENSSKRGKAGEHFHTMPPNQQRLILRFIESLGYGLGKSELVDVPADYELQEGERWRCSAAERKAAQSSGAKLCVERVIEPGLCNDPASRGAVNMHVVLGIQDAMPPWPWPYRQTNSRRGGLLG